MARFRSRLVEIEAEQWWPGKDVPGVYYEREHFFDSPDGGRRVREGPYVLTVHGERAHLAPGDWVIKEPGDGHYPCKPAVFTRRWEPLEENSVSNIR